MTKNLRHLLTAFILGSVITSCGNAKTETLPDPPASWKQVDAFVRGKKFEVAKVGYYGSLTINDKPQAEWIDTAENRDPITLRVMNDLSGWELHLSNDIVANVISKGITYSGSWYVDDIEDESMNEPRAIRLRIKYEDPETSFGGSPVLVTYSYVVKGINEKEVLVELPRTINNRRLIALLKSK